jgi:hypothetical protein
LTAPEIVAPAGPTEVAKALEMNAGGWAAQMENIERCLAACGEGLTPALRRRRITRGREEIPKFLQIGGE